MIPASPDGVPRALAGSSGITRRHRRVSMADVARAAGVSAQTVSRVSTGHPGVVASTRQQVLAAMKQLGYRPNSAAPALKNGEFSRLLEAIATHASRAGYVITLMPVATPTQHGVLGAFTRLGELAVDAVIVVMEVHLLDAAMFVLPPGVHVVVVDSDAGDRYSVVDTDQADGARQAVQHLLDLGHHTVWHVAGPPESFAAGRRATAWRRVLEGAGRPVPSMYRGDWSAESGYRAGLLLADEASCTAVFAGNDQMALGVLRALHEKQRIVPRDISVIGFDDIPDSASFIPPLTTIHQDFAEVGRRCFETALRQIRNQPVEPGTSLVPNRLVTRASTATPRTA
jgi:DNA-binding LacI/PurR family transcriptional regulator